MKAISGDRRRGGVLDMRFLPVDESENVKVVVVTL